MVLTLMGTVEEYNIKKRTLECNRLCFLFTNPSIHFWQQLVLMIVETMADFTIQNELSFQKLISCYSCVILCYRLQVIAFRELNYDHNATDV